MENYSNFDKCFICSEDIKDARMLPCLHSFCFECLRSKFNEGMSNKSNNLKCPKCNLWCELPEGGLENLKKNEFIESLNKTNKTFCGICSKEEVTNLCLDCKLYLCLSCTSVHHKIQATKNHVLSKVNLNEKEDFEATYCKSCQKWVTCERSSDHNSCTLKTSCTMKKFSEFKKEFYENLEQEIIKQNNNIKAIKTNLSAIEVQRLSVTNETDKLKMQIHKHCEDIKNKFIKHIDSCNNKINVIIDGKCDEINEQLDLHSKELLKLNIELEEKINKFENMLQQFDPVKFVEAIENDNLKVLDDDENILRENQNLISKCLNENLNFYFEPKLLEEKLLSSQVSIGNLKSTIGIQLKLIKSIEVSSICYPKLSISKTKLYVGYICNNIYKIDVYCSNKYDYLTSIELHISNLLYYNNVLIDNFLCVLNNSLLEIYNLEKEEESPDWKKTIKFSFIGKEIFGSSGTNLFILEEKKIFETTLDGKIVRIPSFSNKIKRFITLPECIASSGLSDVVCLKNDRFVISYNLQLYLINRNGVVIKQINSNLQPSIGGLFELTNDKNFNLFVAESEGKKIHLFDFDLNFVKSFDVQCKPRNLCFDSTTNRLLVIGVNIDSFSLKVFQL